MYNNWITLLLIIGMFFASLTGWSVYRAASSGSQITDSEYSRQRHLLKQDQHRDVIEQGWTAQFTVTPQMLMVELAGTDGSPVHGAAGQLELLNPKNRAKTLTIPFQENDRGIYLGSLPEDLTGETKGVLSFRLGNKVYRKKLVIFL